MSRLTKLIHVDGLTLASERSHPGNGSLVGWSPPRMYRGPRATPTHHDNQSLRTDILSNRNMQRSKVDNGGVCGTLGYPTDRKIYGYGGSIVGMLLRSKRLYRRELGMRHLSGGPLIIPQKGCEGMVTFGDRLLQLRQLNRDNPSRVNGGTIHIVSDIEVLSLAYELIKSKPGNMTSGIDRTTLDGIDLKWISNVSHQLLAGKFQFSPARRKNIPKPGKKTTRPLGIASPREKVVQKAVQLVFEAIWEPEFLQNSHGFRPGRGNHTALKMTKERFHGVTWVIEADITKCFDTISHDILLGIVRKRVCCDKTVTLVSRALKAGYIDLGKFVQNKEGTPQGSVLSPLLCNIFLHQLDIFMLRLKLEFDKGKSRRKNPDFAKVQYEMNKVEDPLRKKVIRRKLWGMWSRDPLDPNYRRLHYVRYADDFIIGTIGTHEDAIEIKNRVSEFLHNSLGLELNPEKTKVTHLSKGSIEFLGTTIKGNWRKAKPVRVVKFPSRKVAIRTRITPRLGMHAPIKSLFEKAITNGFFRRKDSDKIHPTALKRMVNFDHADIVAYYNQVIRGILNYYSFADNRKSLGSLIHGLKHSCALTLTLKYKLRHASKAYKKYGSRLRCPTTDKELDIPSTFRRNQHFLINEPLSDIFLKKRWNNKLTRSNLGMSCLVCGASPAEMHHVRQIRDLKSKYSRKSIDFWTLQMASINRKQIPLCKDHHSRLHKGTLTLEEARVLRDNIANFVRRP
jgi:group II intron reverse transcriptase/maturase